MAKLTDQERADQERAELKARLDQKWWDKWWAQDFSWAGLAALDEDGDPIHPWQGWSITPDGRVMEREDPALPDESRDATLRDYWRWNGQSLLSDENLLAAGLLEDNVGQPRFHICHLPERWQDGSDSWKTNAEDARWEIIEAELAHRVNKAAKTEAEKTASWQVETLIGPDGRTQLSGAQIRALPRPPAPDPSQDEDQAEAGAYHLRADYTRWLEDTEFLQAVFGSPTRFYHANFSGGKASFYKAQFSGGNAVFRNAQFSGGNADFNLAQFSGGYASFIQTQFSGGNAYFSQAQFSGGDADFEDAQFSGGYAYFTSAQFSGGYADFYNAQFSGGNADFRFVQFSGGYANFEDAQFSGGDANFHQAQFSGGLASFFQAQFSGGEVFFISAEFAHSTGFNGLNPAAANPKDTGPDPLPSHFDFSGSRFKGRTEWIDARFPGTAVFADVIFEEDCFFGQARQSLKPGRTLKLGCVFQGPTSFRNALFKRTADFARSSFPKTAEDRNGLFENCRFNEVLDLKGVERLPFSAFQGIRLDQGLSVDPVHPMEDQFEQALEDAQSAAKRDEIARKADGYEPLEDPERERRGADNRFAALEAGCRVLKHAMAQQGDHHREHQFFRMELMARQKRPVRSDAYRDGQLTHWDRWAARAYGVFADYGASFLRPLVCLLSIALLCASMYIAIGNTAIGWSHVLGWTSHPASGLIQDTSAVPDPPGWRALGLLLRNLLGAVEFSVQQVFRPFFIWAPGYAETGEGWIQTVKATSHPAWWLVIKILATLQSFISIALLFLSGLALRRKFQIG